MACEGAEGFSGFPPPRWRFWQQIVLELRKIRKDEIPTNFLEQYRLRSLVKKYSDYIRIHHPHGGGKKQHKEDNKEIRSYRIEDSQFHGAVMEAQHVGTDTRSL